MGLQHGGQPGHKSVSVLLENVEFCEDHGIPDYPVTVYGHGITYVKPFLYSCYGRVSGELHTLFK